MKALQIIFILATSDGGALMRHSHHGKEETAPPSSLSCDGATRALSPTPQVAKPSDDGSSTYIETSQRVSTEEQEEQEEQEGNRIGRSSSFRGLNMHTSPGTRSDR